MVLLFDSAIGWLDLSKLLHVFELQFTCILGGLTCWDRRIKGLKDHLKMSQNSGFFTCDRLSCLIVHEFVSIRPLVRIVLAKLRDL